MLKGSVLISIFFATRFLANAGPLMCSRYCGNVEFKPICGLNGQEFQLFNNECELKNAECNGQISYKFEDIKKCSDLSEPKHLIDSGMILSIKVEPKSEEVGIDPVEAVIDDLVLPIGSNLSNIPIITSCDFVCLDVYDPVCGVDGIAYKVFSNGCHMTVANCQRRTTWKQVELSQCTTGQVLYSDEIKKSAEVKKSCGICPKYYMPTCGFNGNDYRAFGNICSMGLYNCKNDEKYETAPAEKCGINIAILY